MQLLRIASDTPSFRFGLMTSDLTMAVNVPACPHRQGDITHREVGASACVLCCVNMHMHCARLYVSGIPDMLQLMHFIHEIIYMNEYMDIFAFLLYKLKQ